VSLCVWFYVCICVCACVSVLVCGDVRVHVSLYGCACAKLSVCAHACGFVCAHGLCCWVPVTWHSGTATPPYQHGTRTHTHARTHTLSFVPNSSLASWYAHHTEQNALVLCACLTSRAPSKVRPTVHAAQAGPTLL